MTSDFPELAREGLLAPSGSTEQTHDGTGRVDLAFTVEAKDAPPTTRSVRVPPGVTVFDSASWNGIAIDSTCGGHGTCHKCKVRVAPAGPVSRHDERTFTPAQLEAGWRLACLAQATRNLAVDVPPLTTRPKAATVGVGRQVILRPAVQKRYVELDEPTLADQRTDLARLLDAIDDLEPTCDLAVLRRLPKVLREADFKVTAVVVDEDLIDIEPGDTSTVRYAVAFDLGTTTVVATLLDVETGTPVAVASMLNKQQPYGGDVITRISATMIDPDTLGRLQEAAAATLRELTEQVCAGGRRRPRPRLRGGARGQRHDDRARARHRPRAARGGAVRDVDRDATHGARVATSGSPYTLGRGPRSSPRSVRTSAATSSRGCSPPAWTGTSARGSSSTSAPTARSCCPTATPCSRPQRRPGRRSRAARSGAACAPPTARSRW